MSDYISRKKLLDSMDKRYNEKVGIVPDNLAEGFHQMEMLIKEQPTAFDLESVIEQVKKESIYKVDYERSHDNSTYWIETDSVIEILKSAIKESGGVK